MCQVREFGELPSCDRGLLERGAWGAGQGQILGSGLSAMLWPLAFTLRLGKAAAQLSAGQ